MQHGALWVSDPCEGLLSQASVPQLASSVHELQQTQISFLGELFRDTVTGNGPRPPKA